MRNFISGSERILSALSYAGSSTLIMLLNKAVLSTYNFKTPVLMVLWHMICSAAFVTLFKKWKLVDYPPFEKDVVLEMVCPALCFVVNVLLGQIAVKLLSIPVMTTMRRTTAVFIIFVNLVFHSKRPHSNDILSVFLMISGGFIVAYNDLVFVPGGYLVVIMNNIVTALYLCFLKNKTKSLGKFGALLYNSIIAIPMLALISFILGDFDTLLTFPYLYDFGFWSCFFLSGICGFIINVSVVWCTQSNSALTTSIVGQTKNVLVTAVGIYLFNDFTPTLATTTGITISILGSSFFAYHKYQQNRQKLEGTPSIENALEEKKPFI